MPIISTSRFCISSYLSLRFYFTLFFTILLSQVIAKQTQTSFKSPSIQYVIQQAKIKLNQNKPEEAIKSLLKIRINPASKKEQEFGYAIHFLLGDCYARMNNQKDVALQQYKEAKRWAEILKDISKLGDVYHKIGVCSIDLGKAEDARKAFTLALQYKIQIHGKEHISLALEYNGIGNSYFFTHNLDKALLYYKKALAIGVLTNKYNMDNAMFNQNIAIIYASKGDYDNAFFYFNQSIEINKHLYGEKSVSITQLYLNLGVYFYQIGKPDKASDYYTKAESNLKANPTLRKDLGILYLNKGNIATSQKDFDLALTYYQQSLKILKDFFPEYNPTIITIRTNIGYTFENKGKYLDALNALIKIKSNDPNSPLIIKAERNIAGIYDKLGKFSEANKYYQSSLKKAKTLPNQQTEYAYSLHRYGEFLTTHNKNGLPYLNEALNILGKDFGKKNQEVAFVYSTQGKFYINNKKDYKTALTFFQKALISIEETFSSTNILNTPSVKNAYPSFIYFDILQYKTFTLMNWYKKENKRTDLLKAAMISGEQALGDARQDS